jgi:hypothetical protein
MPPVGSEPMIPASARPQTYAFDRAAAGIGQIPKEHDINLRYNYSLKSLGIKHEITLIRACGDTY